MWYLFIKKVKKNNFNNYRPVSLLSCFKKVLEKCIYNKIFPILQPYICNYQHGFMPNLSTSTNLVEFYELINRIIDKNGQVDVVFMDFSKAFDSVPHSLLLKKLECFGINFKLLSWFKNYLCNRK